MKVLLINGSHHEKGCTYTALSEVEKALNANGVETEIYWIGQNQTERSVALFGYLLYCIKERFARFPLNIFVICR